MKHSFARKEQHEEDMGQITAVFIWKTSWANNLIFIFNGAKTEADSPKTCERGLHYNSIEEIEKMSDENLIFESAMP